MKNFEVEYSTNGVSFTETARKTDGVNLLPFLNGESKDKPHETLYWRFGEQWAIRQGDWKLVAARPDGNKVKLFNLTTDIGEANDLSATQPDKAAELKAAWDAWNAEQKDPLWPLKEGKKKPKQ